MRGPASELTLPTGPYVKIYAPGKGVRAAGNGAQGQAGERTPGSGVWDRGDACFWGELLRFPLPILQTKLRLALHSPNNSLSQQSLCLDSGINPGKCVWKPSVSRFFSYSARQRLLGGGSAGYWGDQDNAQILVLLKFTAKAELAFTYGTTETLILFF